VRPPDFAILAVRRNGHRVIMLGWNAGRSRPWRNPGGTPRPPSRPDAGPAAQDLRHDPSARREHRAGEDAAPAGADWHRCVILAPLAGCSRPSPPRPSAPARDLRCSAWRCRDQLRPRNAVTRRSAQGPCRSRARVEARTAQPAQRSLALVAAAVRRLMRCRPPATWPLRA
jgi:hypothetical protein